MKIRQDAACETGMMHYDPRMIRKGPMIDILVIEDNRTRFERLCGMLWDDCTAETVCAIDEAILLLNDSKRKFAVVLLDVRSKKTGDEEDLERLFAAMPQSGLPIIVLTDSEHYRAENAAIRFGAADFIRAPFRSGELRFRIENNIRRHEDDVFMKSVTKDRVTGFDTLPAFLQKMSRKLREDRRDYDLGIVIVANYTNIYNIYGIAVGEDILKAVAAALRQALPDAQISRIGGQFGILMPSEGQLYEKLEQMQIESPVTNVRIRKGVYQRIDRGQSIEVLQSRIRLTVAADTDKCVIYTPYMEQKRINERNLIASFERSIENREFFIMIQPKIDAVSGTIAAGEALVRWKNADGRMILPGDFIPVFEKEGQIAQLDEYVFKEVCRYQHERIRAGERVVPISVNLSRHSMISSSIVERYQSIAQTEGIDLSLVPVEITESAVTSEKLICEICDDFARAGFRISLDDFGTGSSSLVALITLSLDELKIDKSFIDRIGTYKGNIAVEYIIETGHALGMKITAEGVEQKSQLDFLREQHCDRIQGFYYAGALDIGEFSRLTENG